MRSKIFILLVHGSPPTGVMVQRTSVKVLLLSSPGWPLLYRYTADLLCLNFCRPASNHCSEVLMPVQTLLRVEAWEKALSRHPDTAFAHYVVNGLRHGFRIGFNHSSLLRSAATNMESARQHPEIISDYLAKEQSLGRMLGLFTEEMLPNLPSLHINRFGVIPKGHNTGKWRLITDLSYPHGQSVNDGIDPSLCSLMYATVDEVAEIVVKLGRGALLSKVDIESAYRLIPVHPQDRPLQAMKWDNHIYVDPMLPFGLRSAPKIFNAVADALNWYLHQAGIQYCIHYLDDFIVVTPPGSPEGQKCLTILDQVCSALGVPILPSTSGMAPPLVWCSLALKLTPPRSCCAFQQTSSNDYRLYWKSGVTGSPAPARSWSHSLVFSTMRARWYALAAHSCAA